MHAAMGPRYQMLKSNAANLWESGRSLLFHPSKASTKVDCGSSNGTISRKMRINNTMLLLISLIGVLGYLMDSHYYDEEPMVGHRATQVEETLELVDETSERVDETLRRVDTRPNVIYIQHESLSGSILLNTKKGKSSALLFHDRMANDPDFYVFEHHRTGSGNTIDAMPSLMTGCLPYTEKGVKYAHAKGRSIGYEFAKNGYSTASFSSRALDEDLSTGKWSMMYDMLVGGMDKVESATTNPKVTINNGQGSSDDQMLPLFEKWLHELEQQKEDEENPTEEGATKKPFYAQFYNFNQHFPYLVSKNGNSKVFSEDEGDQYYTSITATDNFLAFLFEILSRTGQLENTIIVGSGDHGEDPFKHRYVRLNALNSHVLHAAAYIYYPRILMSHEGVAERLRRNTQQLSYTLDIYPTIRSILHGYNGAIGYNFEDQNPHSDPNIAARKGCIGGIDLTSVDVPEDRVALATNLASSLIAPSKAELRLYALMTKDYALYHRENPKKGHLQLKQGKNDEYVLKFGTCTKSIKSLCMMSLNADMKEYFRRAVVSLRSGGRGFVGEKVKGSAILKFFVGTIGGEKAISKTKKSMAKELSMAISDAEDQAVDLTADNGIAIEPSTEKSSPISQEALPLNDTKPLRDPSSEGSFSTFLGLIHSTQKKMSWWNGEYSSLHSMTEDDHTYDEHSVVIEHNGNDENQVVEATSNNVIAVPSPMEKTVPVLGEVSHQDVTQTLADPSSRGSTTEGMVVEKPSCDNVMIYMPDMSAHPTIESQLNNYILTAMMATLMNLPMVILDSPADDNFDWSSQFGCLKVGENSMPPGLSYLVEPPKWLSRECAVPCQKSYSYWDWDRIRQSSTAGGIPETVCVNDDGRQSHALVLGGGKTRKYFEKHFKDQMLQRPSPIAHDWALRLGARPEEAKVFSKLKKEWIWDYLGALVARSDLLHFQPWILSDVGDYIHKSSLPAHVASIRQGLDDGMVWGFDRFDAIQVRRGDELLLSETEASQFISQDSETHNHIPLDYYLRHYKCSEEPRLVYIGTNDPNAIEEEIRSLGQYIGRGQTQVDCNKFKFRYTAGHSQGGSKCDERYSGTVASIADFIIFSRVGLFVGDLDSDWGRLVRTFRLKLKKLKKSKKLKKGKTSDDDECPVLLPGTEEVLGDMPLAMVPGW